MDVLVSTRNNACYLSGVDFDKERRCSQVGSESHAKGDEMAHGPHRRPGSVRCPRLPVSTLGLRVSEEGSYLRLIDFCFCQL